MDNPRRQSGFRRTCYGHRDYHDYYHYDYCSNDDYYHYNYNYHDNLKHNYHNNYNDYDYNHYYKPGADDYYNHHFRGRRLEALRPSNFNRPRNNPTPPKEKTLTFPFNF